MHSLPAHHHALSVLLPFYNAESTLPETLDSIQQQTFTDFLLIAIDDGSNDNSARIITERAERDPRIQLIRKERGGVVAASNHGLGLTHSPLVARMDADDIMHPQRLARQVEFLNHNKEIDLVGCQVELFPRKIIQKGFEEYVRWQNRCVSPQDIADEIYVELPIANPSIMFRRIPVLELGGYRDGPFPEDYDLQLRMVRSGLQLAKIPEVLLQWRESDGRLTRTDTRYSRDAFDRLRAKYLSQDSRINSNRPIVVWGAGRKTRRRASLLLEHGISFQAWIDIDPRKIGNTVQGIPVVEPVWLDKEERPFVLGYVNNHGARDLIASDLNSMGYVRGQDYLMVG